jgi:hypothetical protein
MNPCPSARPGKGEQEQNRRGSLSAQSGSECQASEDRGRPILFLLGVPGQSPRIPDQQKERNRGATHYRCARDGRRMAETRIPNSGYQGARFTTARSGDAERSTFLRIICVRVLCRRRSSPPPWPRSRMYCGNYVVAFLALLRTLAYANVAAPQLPTDQGRLHVSRCLSL